MSYPHFNSRRIVQQVTLPDMKRRLWRLFWIGSLLVSLAACWLWRRSTNVYDFVARTELTEQANRHWILICASREPQLGFTLKRYDDRFNTMFLPAVPNFGSYPADSSRAEGLLYFTILYDHNTKPAPLDRFGNSRADALRSVSACLWDLGSALRRESRSIDRAHHRFCQIHSQKTIGAKRSLPDLRLRPSRYARPVS